MLARCPFCGSDDVEFSQDWVQLAQCQCRKCQASGPVCDGPVEAERRWAEIPYLSSRISNMRIKEAISSCVYVSTDGPSIISECRG